MIDASIIVFARARATVVGARQPIFRKFFEITEIIVAMIPDYFSGILIEGIRDMEERTLNNNFLP